MDRIKILCIGNSFSEDTTRYVAEIAQAAGIREAVVANLYIGGCPICKHYHNIQNDLPAYRYGRNDGSGWEYTPDTKISDAIRSEDWDWISIQHGSSFGERYTNPDCYRDLPPLVQTVKALAGPKTKIAFNLTWPGEPQHNHPETVAFDRDQLALFAAICRMTQEKVATVPGIDRISPTGTAVQNARTTHLNSRMNRDGYHLTFDLGRFLAGMTFFQALSGICLEEVSFRPEGVTEEDTVLLLRAAKLALAHPFSVSQV